MATRNTAAPSSKKLKVASRSLVMPSRKSIWRISDNRETGITIPCAVPMP